MPELRLFTTRWRPDHTVTVRAAPDWGADVGGAYDGLAWVFSVPTPPPFQFKFVLDYTTWQGGPNLTAYSAAQNDFGDDAVAFARAELPDPEEGLVSRTYFAARFDPPPEGYDVIVVGSGAGGGVLADELSDRGARTLVLEAGSYLFPSHVANLPRAHRTGTFDKHVWRLWHNPAFQYRPYVNEGAGSQYAGGVGYNLGGRTIFWGGLAPRMREYEFETPAWPGAVRDALLTGPDPYYARAERMLKVSPPRDSPYQDRVKAALADRPAPAVPVAVVDAPMAVQRQTSQQRTLSAGIFSTADLLMESRATAGRAGRDNLDVNLNHEVRRVEVGVGGRVSGVVAYDRIARQERVYTAENVVLCAGALESARIAQQSAGVIAADASGKLGRGITDHQIWYVHFALQTGNQMFSNNASAKVLLQPTTASLTSGGWNAVLELGSDYNQGRYVDEDILEQHQNERGEGVMLCELVFMTSSELLEQNYVWPGDGASGRPMKVHMERGQRAGTAMFGEMTATKDWIMRRLGAVALPGEDPQLGLREADLGAVAHEVGSMRMGDAAVDAVVDADLKFHGLSNLYGCDLSVFPSSPSANPTLALAALAIRLAEKLRPSE